MCIRDRFNFSTLDELLDNPDAVAHFDSDGDGVVEILGCNDDWGCHVVIDDTIEENEWGDRITQVSSDHSELFAQAQNSFDQQGPVLVYVWTPSAFVGKLVPGRDVQWLGIEEQSSLAGQRVPSDVGNACTADPCYTGFAPSDIVISANDQWLADNPAGRVLFEGFVLNPVDVAVAAVAVDAGQDSPENIEAAAAQWIEANRAQVDPLLDQARAAG